MYKLKLTSIVDTDTDSKIAGERTIVVEVPTTHLEIEDADVGQLAEDVEVLQKLGYTIDLLINNIVEQVHTQVARDSLPTWEECREIDRDIFGDDFHPSFRLSRDVPEAAQMHHYGRRHTMRSGSTLWSGADGDDEEVEY